MSRIKRAAGGIMALESIITLIETMPEIMASIWLSVWGKTFPADGSEEALNVGTKTYLQVTFTLSVERKSVYTVGTGDQPKLEYAGNMSQLGWVISC